MRERRENERSFVQNEKLIEAGPTAGRTDGTREANENEQ